ncbi:Uncharacterized protein ImpJ/VasE [hydrothermal vent metagenome]|uniref:Uncharacterized protein ImpJ/VasE n=1 Tax=hydrothermal vent metagenome TaxID=652676 RepID=A0A3B0W3R6_9ZZZZ
MEKNNKIAWMESQYLYPHHFQQQERYLESRIELRANAIRHYIWGFSNLQLDVSLLAEGRIALISAEGIMSDGCPFSLPHHAPLPEAIQINQQTKNQLIYLVLPFYQPGSKYIETQHNTDSIARYKLQQIDIFDYCSSNNNMESIESATLQFRLALESEDLGNFTCLPIARIQEVTQEGSVILDKKYIPCCLNIKTNSQLQNYLNDIIGILKQRGEVLSHRFIASNQEAGSSAIADFMLLQLINRYEPRLEHLSTIKGVHPEVLYCELLGLMGELSTFTTEDKRPLKTLVYNHDDLHSCYQPLIDHLGRHLSAVLEQTAIALPVDKRQYGVYVSRISDRNLLTQARFILAIHAEMSTVKLREYLPSHIKIGSPETIRDLVNNQLTGITLTSLPVAPREIPYQTGYVYFQLDEHGDQWQSLKSSGGFAFHIPGDLPKLGIEFWAIRS